MDAISQSEGVGAPINHCLSLFDFARIGDAIGVLRSKTQPAMDDIIPALLNQIGRQVRQSAGQIACRFVRLYGHGELSCDGTCVETGFHAHEADASHVVPGHDCPLYRRRASPSREEGCMKVQTSILWGRKGFRWQDQTIGGDDCDIDFKQEQLSYRFGASQGPWRKNWKSQRLRLVVHRGPCKFETAPPGRLGRLRINRDDFGAERDKSLQGGDGKLRRAHEYRTHAVEYHRSGLASKTGEHPCEIDAAKAFRRSSYAPSTSSAGLL
jgi:hypothetical protein